MSEYPEQETAAAYEHRNNGPLRKCPKLMTNILFFEYLRNSGLEVLRV